MSIEVVNLSQKFGAFHDQWSPRIAGEVNESYVKLTKLQGEFFWHQHEKEDELFLIMKGTLHIRVREDGQERDLTIRTGEFVVIPHGVEHLPYAEEEVEVLLLEPKTTLNTGNVRNERTKEELEKV